MVGVAGVSSSGSGEVSGLTGDGVGVSGEVLVSAPARTVGELRVLVDRLSSWGVDEWRSASGDDRGQIQVDVLSTAAGDLVKLVGPEVVAGVQVSRLRSVISSRTYDRGPLEDLGERWGRPKGS